MRKRRLIAAMIAIAMTVGMCSPVQAAGYCINGNGSNCQVVVGGNCLNGNLVKEILSNSNCNNSGLVKGASDNNDCSNGNCADPANSCSSNGNAYKIVIGGNCGDESCATKQESQQAAKNGNSCQPAAKPDSTCQQAAKSNITCRPIGKTTEQATTEQPVVQVPVFENTEQPVTESPVTESPVSEQPATESPVPEQPVTQIPTTEQPTTEQEKKPEAAAPSETTEEEISVEAMSEDQSAAAVQVLDLVNQNRSSSGLHALRLDAELCAAAQIRANEIVASFSHTRPDGRKFSTVLTDNGIRFTAAGENIAWGQTSPSQVMNAWMNSEGHRANIMNRTYTKLGVGHVTVGGRQYWVQLFSY